MTTWTLEERVQFSKRTEGVSGRRNKAVWLRTSPLQGLRWCRMLGNIAPREPEFFDVDQANEGSTARTVMCSFQKLDRAVRELRALG
jgi:hypothetical protein